MKKTTLVMVLCMFGCGQEVTKDKEAIQQIVPKEVLETMQKASNEMDKQKAEAEAFLQSVKTNPQPLFDRAVKAVKEGIAEQEGDEESKAATVTVQKETLKTFGPEKWKVRGNLHTSKHDTTWEVELQMMFDQLQVRHVILQVED